VRYRNLQPPFEPQPLSNVLKWAVGDKLRGKRRRSPKRFPGMKVVEPDRALLASGAPSLTWVGHATWLIRLGGQSILTDPVWSESLGPGITRNVRPGISTEEARPSVVLVSHNHRDHLDAPTIRRLGAAQTYVVPAGLGPFFRRAGADKVVELEWWGRTQVGSLTIDFVPSQHWSQRGATDKNDTLWGGFVVEGDQRRVYFAGDTAYFEGFKEIGRRFPGIDAALLPIGAYDPEWFMRVQHMNPEDAVNAFQSLGARLLCAMHWGTFKLTDEPLDEPPRLLEEMRQRQGISADQVWVAAIGESRRL
jgi:L-ascorbate metabolism protein UlaG (beta-lactamase superfamily)